MMQMGPIRFDVLCFVAALLACQWRSIAAQEIPDPFPPNYTNERHSVLSLPLERAPAEVEEAGRRYAYATLLYNDEVLDGARVLGFSLKESGTPHEMVAIVTERVSEWAVQVLIEDGWHVERAHEMLNPHRDHPLFQQRLSLVFSKLNIYSLTSYHKIVYLDTDTQVLENIDELFRCPGICASVRNSFFNAGVLVFTPSRRLYMDLVAQAALLPSYNGGEQGLLNSYLADFNHRCPMFAERSHQSAVGPEEHCARLPAYYNGDIGPYYLQNAIWVLPHGRATPKVIHYTLGPFKPWQWWPFAVLDIFWTWYRAYERMEQGSSGLLWFEVMLVEHLFTFALPLIVFAATVLLAAFTPLLALCHRATARLLALGSSAYIRHASKRIGKGSLLEVERTEMERNLFFILLSVCFSAASLAVAVLLSLKIAAHLPTMHPYSGMVLCLEWLTVIHLVTQWSWNRVCFLWSSFTVERLSVGRGDGSLRKMTVQEELVHQRRVSVLTLRSFACTFLWAVAFGCWLYRGISFECEGGEFWYKTKTQVAAVAALILAWICISIWLALDWCRAGRKRQSSLDLPQYSKEYSS